MSFDICADCGSALVTDLVEVLIIGLALGIVISVFLILRGRSQSWCRLDLATGEKNGQRRPGLTH